MAWRPYANLIDGELDNRTPGKVTGWMRFFRRDAKPLRVSFDLAGDFHEDIRGKVIRLRNLSPSEEDAGQGDGTYMEGFSQVQRGSVGDITAGLPLGPWTEELARKFMAQNELAWAEMDVPESEREERRKMWSARYRERIQAGELCYAYAPYPYLEWYSDLNGRVVLELGPAQLEVFDIQGVTPQREKTPKELLEDGRKRSQAMAEYMSGMVKEFSEENRKRGGDGDVTGVVIG